MEDVAQRCLSADGSALLSRYSKYASVIFGYWATYYETSPELVLTSFARCIDVFPQARAYAIRSLSGSVLHLRAVATANETALAELLVAIWRLLRYDVTNFRGSLDPKLLSPLLRHQSPAVRLLTLNVISYSIEMADELLSNAIDESVGHGSIKLTLEEGMTVDLRIFTVQEDLRVREAIARLQTSSNEDAMISETELPANVAMVGQVFLPRIGKTTRKPSLVVPTTVSTDNLQRLACAVAETDAILLQGLSGSGKTFLIEDLARAVGRERDLVRIHLGDQTDAKLLLGTYITSEVPGQFVWQAGVLANAVSQGKWLLIEDIDKAPSEVLSILLPLLETSTILVPSRDQVIHAGAGFKMFATKTTHQSSQWNPDKLLGGRLWTSVVINMAPDVELQEVIVRRYPLLRNMGVSIMSVYEAVSELVSGKSQPRLRKETSGRPLGTLDLMKWCRRIEAVYKAHGVVGADDQIPQAVSDDIFSEAVDCFASSIPSVDGRRIIVETIGSCLQVPPERVHLYLEQHSPELSEAHSFLRVGRASLVRKSEIVRRRRRPFAFTGHALRLLEQVMVSVRLREPLLLVGETGTGKTSVIQQLADMMGRNLVAINMSQQTESGDLLGGFKPVDTKLLAVPLLENFENLFQQTLSAHKNARFLSDIRRCYNKAQWPRLVTLLREATKIAKRTLDKSRSPPVDGPDQDERRKRRRFSEDLPALWAQFAASLESFRIQHSQISKTFTFAFVEGALIRAVRRGDWVLLDEINLAASDTLESINGLLQDGGSILLSEKGDLQAIEPHPDFRLFSCMNPSTDVGKRDLPAGIRSRFTELYVQSPDSNIQDLHAIIHKYIGGLCHEDSKACPDVAHLYIATKNMAATNQLVDGGNQRPHYSIRTLARTLSYVVEISPIYGLRRSLYEGFCMSYLTLLNKESENLLRPVIEEFTILRVKNARSFMSQIPRQPVGNEWVQFKYYWLPKGPLDLRDDERYIMTPFVEKNMLNLVRAASTKKYPILLQGPTSSGKTSMVEYLAKKTGHAFVRINNHEHTDLQEYLGSYMSDVDGNLVFKEGILVQALRQGQWLVLDELNLAPTDVLEALNRLLDDNRELLIPETQEVVKPHPSFILFATQNPAGLYGGRKHLSRAFRNRFLELHFEDIPEDELETILCQRCQVAPSYCKRIVEVYKQLSFRRQSSRVFEQKNSFATLRDLFRWATRPAVGYDELALNGYLLLAERVRREEEKLIVREVIEKVMKVSLTAVDNYDIAHLPEYQALESDRQDNKVVWTRAMRRLFVLLAVAFRNNEPVLLVGETGCGKTTVCQVISEALRRPMQTLNAHQNTETADIIGAQRPIRGRSLVADRLAHDLAGFLEKMGGAHLESPDMRNLKASLDSLDLDTLSIDHPDIIVEAGSLKSRLARSKALFEWSDGPLIQAMKTGEIFLLDEISLAEDAVLERLNSVLETSRTIVLAEKGTEDSTLTASPLYQFCATMNPGGDFGKKELSPALRNRFTEIWVPSVSEDEDILQILRATLRDDRAHLAPSMVSFAQFFCRTFTSALTSPSVSIRDLLAWARFSNLRDLDFREAFVQGAALVYIDALGAMMLGYDQDESAVLDDQRTQCLAELTRLVGFECRPHYQIRYQLQSTSKKIAIGPYEVSEGDSVVARDRFEIEAPTTFLNATRVFRAMQLRKPILLEGSPGVGKTSLISAIASMTSRTLVRINLSDQTDLMDLFGSDSPVEDAETIAFAWRDAPFLRAMQRGDWVLLDEMNLASQSILEGLNACLDHRGTAYIPELNRTFSCHPQFRIFAAQNPHSQGGGRKGLPKSFVNRFTVVYCDPLTALDIKQICQKQFSTISSNIVSQVIEFIFETQRQTLIRSSFALAGGPWEFNLRDVLRWLSLLQGSGEVLHASYYANVIVRQRFRSLSDREHADELLVNAFSADASYRPSFVKHTATSLAIGRASISRHESFVSTTGGYSPIWSSLRETAESVLLCVQKAWPCILVGGPGSGKSSLINSLSKQCGSSLHVMPMNNDMDASDLLGSFEQRDINRSFVRVLSNVARFCEDVLRSDIYSERNIAVMDMLSNISAGNYNVELIRAAQDLLAKHTPETDDILSELSELEYELGQPSLGHFQWSNGSLIRAINEGQWLVLDNANLCNPSVLDRLNSLLEPNGQLVVNERILADGSPMVVVPHKDFRLFLTMDPKHGELSRAMRNRGVELFLSRDCEIQEPSILNSTSSSANLWSSIVASTKLYEVHKYGESRYVAEAVLRHVGPGTSKRDVYSLPESEQELLQLTFSLQHELEGLHQHRSCLQSDPGMLCSARSLTSNAIEEFRCLESAFLYQETQATWHQTTTRLSRAPIRGVKTEITILSRMRDRINALTLHSLVSKDARALHVVELLYLRLICFEHQSRAGISLELVISVLRSLRKTIAEASPALAYEEFAQILDTSVYLAPLTSGHCMEALWAALRPTCPTTETGTIQYNTVLSLLDRLDATLQRTNISSDAARALQVKYLQTMHAICLQQSDQGSVVESDYPIPIDGEQPMDLSSAESSLQILFAYVLRKLKLQQVANFTSWHAETCPVSHDLLILSSFAQERTVDLLDFVSPCTSLERGMMARFSSLCKSALTSGGKRNIETLTGSDLPADHFSSFLTHWRSILVTAHQLPLGKVEHTLSELNQVGAQVSRHNLTVLQPRSRSLYLIAVQFLLNTTIIVANTEQTKVFSNLTELPELMGHHFQQMKAWVASAKLPEDPADLLVDGIDNLERYRNSNTDVGSEKHLALAWIHLSRAFLILYVPSLPKDPGSDAIVEAYYRDWYLARTMARTAAHEDVHAAFTGGTESPQSDLLKHQINQARVSSSQATRVSLLRPKTSLLYQMQSEFDFVLTMVQVRGTTQQLTETLQRNSESAGPESSNFLTNLARLEVRLSAYDGYKDIVHPILHALGGLRQGIQLLRTSCMAAQQPAKTVSSSLLPDPTKMFCYRAEQEIDQKLVLPTEHFSIATLRYMLEVSLRIDCFGHKDSELAILQKLGQHMFEQWFVRREREMTEAAQATSVFKFTAAEEPTLEDYREIFPDYEDPSTHLNMSAKHSDVEIDHKIFRLYATILDKAASSTLQRSSTKLLDVVNELLDLPQVTKSIDDNAASRARLLAMASYASYRDIGVMQSEALLNNDKLYDFYRSPNIAETRKLVPLLEKLLSRVYEVIAAWPENSVLIEIREEIQRLMGSSMTAPLAQTLTMLEQTFQLLAQWQEVASREFSISNLFDELRSRIIEWRRFELSCWPRLFDLEEATMDRKDTQIWYNLYEVIVFTPSQHGHDVNFEFLSTTIRLLMQFVRSSTIGQFAGRLRNLKAFAQLTAQKAITAPKYLHFSQAIEHVFNYFSCFRTSIQQFLSQERKVLAKEVSQVIKLASWKDTNVFALRESSRRSHRTLYKIVHKYRRVLLTPAQQILAKGLSKDVDHTSAVVDAIEIKITETASLRGAYSTSTAARPLRYQLPERTAAKIESVIRLMGEAVSNQLRLFVDNAVADMEQLRADTPTTFDKSQIALVKNLKNRKRKLLSDSFKNMKVLGLKSATKPDDLEKQRDLEALFLTTEVQKSTTNSVTLDKYLYRIAHILPDVRAGYANHAEDVTAGEVKRGTGYFDSIFTHLLHERTSFVACASSKTQFDGMYETYVSLFTNHGTSEHQLETSGNAIAFADWQTRLTEAYIALEQLLTMTSSMHDAYIHSAKVTTMALANQDWWKRLLLEVADRLSSLASTAKVLLPSETVSDEMREHSAALTSILSRLQTEQERNPHSAFVYSLLTDWLSSQDIDGALPVVRNCATTTLGEIDSSLQRLCDQMLISTQDISALVEQYPQESEEFWYLKSTRNRRAQLNALSLAKVTRQFGSFLMNLQTHRIHDASLSLQGLFSSFEPIIRAYQRLCQSVLHEFQTFHQSTSRCTLLIGQTLNTLATNGFCSPQPSDSAPADSSATEAGTGLGTGEGVDDITKDLEDDEDLGDLEGADDAQSKGDDEDGDAKEIEEDVGGELEDVDDKRGSEEEESGNEEENDIEDEIGEVEDQNDTALDEKMWDSEKDDLRNKETEKQNEDESAQDNNDIDMVNKEGEEKEEAKNDQKNKEQQEEDAANPENQNEDADDAESEVENDVEQDAEKADPNLEQGENLELPEDLNMDDASGEDEEQENQGSDIDEDEHGIEQDNVDQEDLETSGDKDIDEEESALEEEDKDDLVGDEQDDKIGDEHEEDDLDAETDDLPIEETDVNNMEESTEEGGPESGGKDSNSKDVGQDDLKDKDTMEEMDLDIDTEDTSNENAVGTESAGSHGQSTGKDVTELDKQGAEELRSLGDALENFRRMLHIHEATPQQEHDGDDSKEQADGEIDQFEHVQDEQDHNQQAMGPSNQDEQGAAKDEDQPIPELEDNRADEAERIEQDDVKPEDMTAEQEKSKEVEVRETAQSMKAMMPKKKEDTSADDVDMFDENNPDDMSTSVTQVTRASTQLWQQHEQSTRDLANGLCEQLRLILEPTMATKMRGDFRTGKRLNMRRIIPYIASQFKKDKIWMRRSKPSKRQYQVMLAIDDSKSMSESSSIQLAFDTVALVSTALSVLEVGQMSVVKFGAQPEIVHSFQDQFSSEAGARIFESFSFDQKKTNVKALAAQSLEMFREARAAQHSSGAELWQLQFIISDGICEDHESIRRIMRQAQEDRIMVVFLVIDTVHGAKKHSILQMSQVKYLVQPDGSKKLHIVQYMEEFAFENFLIIQDVRELPELLCSTLRQFFAASQ